MGRTVSYSFYVVLPYLTYLGHPVSDRHIYLFQLV